MPDDPEKMTRMRQWLATAAAEIGVDPGLVTDAEEPLLAMISAVAHGPSRPGAPLTAFLVGVAVGRGVDADAAELAGRLTQRARDYTST